MQSLGLQQQQKLQQRLSPAQILAVRLLEVPSYELSQRINEELQENPALEEVEDGRESARIGEDEYTEQSADEYQNPLQNEDFDYDAYIQDDEIPDYRLHSTPSGVDDEMTDIPMTAGVSFGEYLKSQVYLTKMDKPHRHIAKFIIGNIDEDGYLRRTAEELSDDLAFREGLNVSEEEITDIIREIQCFDPPGVGAKDLKECLLIQLRQQPATDVTSLAIRVLETAFDDFSKRHFDKVCVKCGVSEEELKQAVQEITRLNPKPGSAWTGTVYDRHLTTVIPDFIVDTREGELVVTLNTGELPELRINREYSQLIEDYASNTANQTTKMKEAVQFVKQKIDSARWFIDAIEQRNETLLKTMNAIIEKQKDFFLEGDSMYLKPMILQDIADMTGYDVSTISRVSNSKYVQTEFGVFPLKYFFTSGMTTTEGEEVSSREVKQIMQEIIAGEDKSRPLTDEQMVKVLAAYGYQIARRTVVKYREQMGIPVARLRKEV
ncbi:MAG: RNA polymerase factor sigma-54 [Paludibacteraceae bacterium]|nr:RNA polymerase factor sigma-54 [Paludibacteraceae bacterium]